MKFAAGPAAVSQLLRYREEPQTRLKIRPSKAVRSVVIGNDENTQLHFNGMFLHVTLCPVTLIHAFMLQAGSVIHG